jgi:aerobic-type carbon monoxide dehydrogenase small subunit (CoxS/CutS family)
MKMPKYNEIIKRINSRAKCNGECGGCLLSLDGREDNACALCACDLDSALAELERLDAKFQQPEPKTIEEEH